MKHDIFSAVANNSFDLILLPTEQCNFRCTYCYEDFNIGKMPTNVITGVKNLINKRVAELDFLKIEWFGGEPTANLKTVLDISAYAKQLAHNNSCQFAGVMTTNGYLLKPTIFEKLIAVGVTGYQISLDGTEIVHNKTRLRADGSGTFNRIWQNLERMAETNHNFHVMLRLHITPENIEEILKLIEQINNRFIGDKRFSIFLKAIGNLGGINDGKFAILEGQHKFDILQQLTSLIKINNETMYENTPYICYAAKTNSLVVRANGRIAKCTVMLNDERNDIGHIKEDGRLVIDNQKLKPWVRGLFSKDKKALGCPMHGLPTLEKTSPTNKENLIPVAAV